MGIKVLVADDSNPIRKHMVEMIGQVPGVEEVMETANGWDTVATVLNKKVDVLILDIQMPLGNGLDVLAAIKTHLDEITVIVVTAFPFPQYRRKCLESGAAYFFDKAKDSDRYIEVIAGLASQGVQREQTDVDGTG